MGFHFSYPRDGGPIACNCVIGHDHDVDAEVLRSPLTIKEELVLRTVVDLVADFVTRRKDYLFTREQLEEVITTGEVSKAQIKAWFVEELDKYFP